MQLQSEGLRLRLREDPDVTGGPGILRTVPRWKQSRWEGDPAELLAPAVRPPGSSRSAASRQTPARPEVQTRAQRSPVGVGEGRRRGRGWLSSVPPGWVEEDGASDLVPALRVGVLSSLTTQDGGSYRGRESRVDAARLRSDLVENGTGLKPGTQAGWGSGEGAERALGRGVGGTGDGCKRRGAWVLLQDRGVSSTHLGGLKSTEAQGRPCCFERLLKGGRVITGRN